MDSIKLSMKSSNDLNDLFLKLPLSVLKINKLSFNGKQTAFSLADKVVYSYFLSKIKYYCWEKGGEYFDTQEDISQALGTDVQVVRRSINKLIDYGLLKATKVRWKGRWKWKYTDISILAYHECSPLVEPDKEYLYEDMDAPNW